MFSSGHKRCINFSLDLGIPIVVIWRKALLQPLYPSRNLPVNPPCKLDSIWNGKRHVTINH